MNNWSVYEHISPSGKIYVGITSRSPKRRWMHGHAYKNCLVFNRAIQKYGWDNMEHIVIATGLGEGTAKNMERDLIAFNRESGISYNMTDGGEGASGHNATPKQREHAASIWKDKKIPRDIVEKSASKRRGVKLAKEHVEHIRISKIGNGNGNKAVVEIQDNKIIREYKSCVEAAHAIGVHPNCVSAVCRGVRTHTMGMVFKYKKDVLAA